MWDTQDKFYYNVSMTDHSFEFEGQSLKRKELIGFLPMWARVAAKQQAEALVKHLTDGASFWRNLRHSHTGRERSALYSFRGWLLSLNGAVWLLWTTW